MSLKEAVMLRRWEVFQNNLFLSTELITYIDHRKEFLELTFRALALRQGEWLVSKEESIFKAWYRSKATHSNFIDRNELHREANAYSFQTYAIF